MDEQTEYPRFEIMGEQKVRDFAPHWSAGLQNLAYQWLAERDAERDRKKQDFNLEQARLARITKNASLIAAVATVITVAVTFLAWFFPRH